MEEKWGICRNPNENAKVVNGKVVNLQSEGCDCGESDIRYCSACEYVEKTVVKPIISASGKAIPNDGHDMIYFSR